LIRIPTAILLASLVVAIALSGCANRGMKPPGDGGAGNGGAVGVAGRGGNGGVGGRAGVGGTAGGGTGGSATGTAGTVGSGTAGRGGGGGGGSGGSASCNITPNSDGGMATDAGVDGGAGTDARVDGGAGTDARVDGGTCPAMFNFESGTHGAMINTASQLAFQTIARSGTYTFCGTGALAITSMFSGTSGNSIKGEVLIPLPGSPVNLINKTITVRVAADPGCSSDLNLVLVLNTQAGPVYFTPTFPIRPLTAAWKTGMVTLSADAGAMTALTLSLQAFSTTGYQGTIYVDEIDIR
jgi:hypothetical protein